MKEKINIRYLPLTDLAYGYHLKEAVEVIEKIVKKTNKNMTDILNLYEITLYLNDYNSLNENGQILLNSISKYKEKIDAIMGKYFSEIYDNNFNNKLLEINDNYHFKSTIINCFEKYKVFDKITDNTFKYALDNDLIEIYDILNYKKIVKKYETIIKSKLLSNVYTAELFVEKYDYKEKAEIILPSFTEAEKKEIFSNYLTSNDSNINYLRAMQYHINSGDSYVLSNIQRIEIKNLIKKKNDEIYKSGFVFGRNIEIIIDATKDDIIPPIINKEKHIYTFPGKWINENLDFPTLLNNFISILNYVDLDMNFIGLANEDHEGELAKRIFRRNSTSYRTGFIFDYAEAYNNCSFYSYINYLKKNHNIDVENIIEWFFNTYLPSEFNITNFKISLSTDSRIINRCKVLFPEFDSILKKYRLYNEFKTINNEYLSATKEYMKIDDCPSMIKDKYLVLNEKNEEIKTIIYLLFSTQCTLAYINDNLKDSFFARLILKNNVKINYYEDLDFNANKIKFLLEKNIIYLDAESVIRIKPEILAICRYLFDNKFIRNHMSSIEKEFISKGYVLPFSKLFAPEEANYLNYNLNNSKYGDAKALSNIYRHGDITTEDEEKIFSDYLTGLRILILIIIKINDELCTVYHKN